MMLAAMPKTTINEDSHPASMENKVRTSCDFRVAPPATNSIFSKDSNQS
jgi:hypothetical protein